MRWWVFIAISGCGTYFLEWIAPQLLWTNAVARLMSISSDFWWIPVLMTGSWSRLSEAITAELWLITSAANINNTWHHHHHHHQQQQQQQQQICRQSPQTLEQWLQTCAATDNDSKSSLAQLIRHSWQPILCSWSCTVSGQSWVLFPEVAGILPKCRRKSCTVCLKIEIRWLKSNVHEIYDETRVKSFRLESEIQGKAKDETSHVAATATTSEVFLLHPRFVEENKELVPNASLCARSLKRFVLRVRHHFCRSSKR